ncbi:MAG: hypothetical protein QME28_03105 [Candidatus Saccharicenans sp.]|nr:hypothetical protein [Candidatus Saccharicenans sp.]
MARAKKVKAASKKTARKTAKKAATKKVARKVVKKEVASPQKPVTSLECQVCGYRLIVDRKCGCVEEHALICCGQPMQKVETTV